MILSAVLLPKCPKGKGLARMNPGAGSSVQRCLVSGRIPGTQYEKAGMESRARTQTLAQKYWLQKCQGIA